MCSNLHIPVRFILFVSDNDEGQIDDDCCDGRWNSRRSYFDRMILKHFGQRKFLITEK